LREELSALLILAGTTHHLTDWRVRLSLIGLGWSPFLAITTLSCALSEAPPEARLQCRIAAETLGQRLICEGEVYQRWPHALRLAIPLASALLLHLLAALQDYRIVQELDAGLAEAERYGSADLQTYLC